MFPNTVFDYVIQARGEKVNNQSRLIRMLLNIESGFVQEKTLESGSLLPETSISKLIDSRKRQEIAQCPKKT